jgi:DNA-binding XRE family transcriptional regulator
MCTDRHVGSRVRVRRLIVGLSLDALARRLDVTSATLQRHERGEEPIGALVLSSLSEALAVPVGYFFETELGGRLKPTEHLTKTTLLCSIAEALGVPASSFRGPGGPGPGAAPRHAPSFDGVGRPRTRLGRAVLLTVN